MRDMREYKPRKKLPVWKFDIVIGLKQSQFVRRIFGFQDYTKTLISIQVTIAYYGFIFYRCLPYITLSLGILSIFFPNLSDMITCLSILDKIGLYLEQDLGCAPPRSYQDLSKESFPVIWPYQPIDVTIADDGVSFIPTKDPGVSSAQTIEILLWSAIDLCIIGHALYTGQPCQQTIRLLLTRYFRHGYYNPAANGMNDSVEQALSKFH
jgi:hypothetical protein